LAIARSIVVDKHGGNITFTSAVGKGTTFFVRLPLGNGATWEENNAAPRSAHTEGRDPVLQGSLDQSGNQVPAKTGS
jgi:hypothetical protein